jgi:hypothetical protein
VGHVVGADHDDGERRLEAVLDGIRQLLHESRGLGADDRAVGEPDRSPGEGGDPVGDDRADGLLCVVRAHARGRGVAEDEHLQRRAGAGSVDPVVVRRPVEGLADDASGDRGLCLDETVAERAEARGGSRDTATAVRSGRGDPLCTSGA